MPGLGERGGQQHDHRRLGGDVQDLELPPVSEPRRQPGQPVAKPCRQPRQPEPQRLECRRPAASRAGLSEVWRATAAP